MVYDDVKRDEVGFWQIRSQTKFLSETKNILGGYYTSKQY